jgi:threonine/homoserine/homoserine lactone efflux protein
MAAMVSASTLFAFVVSAVALMLVPGPSMLFLLARGIGEGRRVAVISAFGVETATAVFVAATAVGLTAVVASSVTLFATVRYVGAAYLIYLGVRTLRAGRDLPLASRPAPARPGRAYRQAFFVGISNPKVALFFLAFFPQFIDTHRGPAAYQVLVLGSVFVVLGLGFDLCYGLAAGTIGRLLRRRPVLARRQRYVTGLIYLGLGGSAALGTGHHRG